MQNASSTSQTAPSSSVSGAKDEKADDFDGLFD
jgi:hypothetical protein